MTIDSFGEIINSESTYSEIAAALRMGRTVMIGWTDEDGAHFDILFRIKAD